MVPVDTGKSIKKTELFDNQVSVSFYITKDGVKLDKDAVEKHISVLLNEEYASLKTNVVVATDGTITITGGLIGRTILALRVRILRSR